MTIVLTLQLNTTSDIEAYLYKQFSIYNHIHNVCIKYAIRHIYLLERDKEYIELQNKYKNKKELSKNEKAERLRLIKKYHLSEYEFQHYLKKCAKNYNVYADVVQKIATQTWQAVEKYLFGNGKMIHFKKVSQVKSFEGKSNNNALIFRNNNLITNGKKIPVLIRKKDTYAIENLKNKISYCRILRKWHKTKWRYYVQLLIDGAPKSQTSGNGIVGIDIGPSTIAVVSDTEVKLEEIAQNVNSVEDEIANLNRKIDILKRRDNPNNYDEDKTIKKGHHKWIKSKEQLKLEAKRKWLYQKRQNLLDYHHNCYAKELLKLGDTFIVEDMQFAKIAQNLNCGKSIGNHAPAKLIQLLKQKANSAGAVIIEVNCFKTAATQFDHTSGSYNKHELEERFISLDNGDMLQRDLHSAFNLKYIIIIKHKDKIEYMYDINQMNLDYKEFKIKHDDYLR